MPDSLLFDGIDDYIEFSPGDTTSPTQDLTVAVVAKLIADETAYKSFVGMEGSGDATFGTNNASPHNLAFWSGGGAVVLSTFTIPASDGWCIYVYTGPIGSGTMHKYVFDTTTWTHEAQTEYPASLSTITGFIVGAAGDLTNDMDANILIAGWWDSILSEATIETLSGGTQAWVNANPTECWRLNTLSSISSLTGSSTETTRTGTTVDTGNAPTGWVDLQVGRTYKRLYGPAQLTASAADLYTCPADTVARVLGIHASNPSGSPVDINLSIGADAAATRIFEDYAVPADGIVRESYPYELAAGEKIQGWADSAGTVVLSITGYEDPVRRIAYARRFNGTSDEIELTSTDWWDSGGDITIGPFSVFAIARRINADTGYGWFWSVEGDSTNEVAIGGTLETAVLTAWTEPQTNSSPSTLFQYSDGWCLIGATKAAGTSSIRFHRYRYSDSNWVHENGSSGTDQTPTSASQLWLGTYNGASEWWEGDIAVVGAWRSTALSDGDVEGLTANLSAWEALSPTGLWLLDQASAATAVTDRVGAGDQIAINGTTAVTVSNLPFNVR